MQQNILLHSALENIAFFLNFSYCLFSVCLHDFLGRNHSVKIDSKRQQCFEKSFKSKLCNIFFHFEPLFILEFSLCLHDFFWRNHSMKIDYSRHASLKMHQNTCYKKFSNKIQNNGNCKEKKSEKFCCYHHHLKHINARLKWLFSPKGCATKKSNSW